MRKGGAAKRWWLGGVIVVCFCFLGEPAIAAEATENPEAKAPEAKTSSGDKTAAKQDPAKAVPTSAKDEAKQKAGQAVSEEKKPDSIDLRVIGIYVRLSPKSRQKKESNDIYLYLPRGLTIPVTTELEVFRVQQGPKIDMPDPQGKVVTLSAKHRFPVGKVKVISRQADTIVARLVSLSEPEESPNLPRRAILVGDIAVYHFPKEEPATRAKDASKEGKGKKSQKGKKKSIRKKGNSA